MKKNEHSPKLFERGNITGLEVSNRMRFLMEVIRNIKRKCPTTLLSIRLSGCDFEPGGITIEETVEVAKACEANGADVINLTWGSHAEVVNAAGILSEHGANHVDMAKMIKDAVSIPVMLCGGIYTPEIGEKLLEDGICDYVGIGKPALADPMWAKKAKEGRSEDIRPCIGCVVGCHDRGMLSGGMVQCAVNLRQDQFFIDGCMGIAYMVRLQMAGAKNMTDGRLYAHSLRSVLDTYAGGEVERDSIPFERTITHERIAFMDIAGAMTVDFTSEELGQERCDSYSVLRGTFDQWLAKLAEDAGCEMICGIAVENLLRDESGCVASSVSATASRTLSS